MENAIRPADDLPLVVGIATFGMIAVAAIFAILMYKKWTMQQQLQQNSSIITTTSMQPHPSAPPPPPQQQPLVPPIIANHVPFFPVANYAPFAEHTHASTLMLPSDAILYISGSNLTQSQNGTLQQLLSNSTVVDDSHPVVAHMNPNESDGGTIMMGPLYKDQT
jgi:hypothetical protein